MNDTEKFLFDLQGFLKVPDFLTPDEVDALNAAFDANEDKRGEDGNHNTGGSDALEGQRRGIFTGMLEWENPPLPALPRPFGAQKAHPLSRRALWPRLEDGPLALYALRRQGC